MNDYFARVYPPDGEPPLAGNDGPPVAPSAPSTRWPWFGVAVAVAVLIAALRWPADGPVYWCNIALGSGLGLLLWAWVLWLRRRARTS